VREAIDRYLKSLGPPKNRRRISIRTSLAKRRASYGKEMRSLVTREHCRDFIAKMKVNGYSASQVEARARAGTRTATADAGTSTSTR
jgi:hypothetical protein